MTTLNFQAFTSVWPTLSRPANIPLTESLPEGRNFDLQFLFQDFQIALPYWQAALLESVMTPLPPDLKEPS